MAVGRGRRGQAAARGAANIQLASPGVPSCTPGGSQGTCGEGYRALNREGRAAQCQVQVNTISRENICFVEADGRCAGSHESGKQYQWGPRMQGFDELVPRYRATPLSGPGVDNGDAATGSLLLGEGKPVAAHAWAATLSRFDAFILREAPDGWASPLQSAGLVMYQYSHALQTSGSARWCSQRPTLRPAVGCPTLSRSAFRTGTSSQTACMLWRSSAMYGSTRLAAQVGNLQGVEGQQEARWPARVQ